LRSRLGIGESGRDVMVDHIASDSTKCDRGHYAGLGEASTRGTFWLDQEYVRTTQATTTTTMNQFVQRVVNYVANEILIKGLANSKTFQRFAVKTDHSLRKGTESLQQTIEELAKQQVRTSSSSTTARQRPPPIKPQTGACPRFRDDATAVPPAGGPTMSRSVDFMK
jgi:hypothetical protein